MEGRIQEYAELLGGVELFQHEKDSDGMALICNALEERYFMQGEIVVRQGDGACSFFIIFEGTCSVYVDGEEVGQLTRGHFFGERALIEDDLRAATVTVTSENSTMLALDRVAFNLLLAPAEGADDDDSASATLRNLSGRYEKNCPLMQKLRQQFLKTKALRSSITMIQTGESILPMEQLERIGVLGRGAFGFVSLERDKLTSQLYALKAMSKGHIVQERLKDMVSNEKACMELLDSDFIVRLVCTYRDERNIYLLLEPCFGGELFDVYDARDDLFGSEVHAKFYTSCIAMGLEHMHSRRIIYRDLKLENCLLTLTGYVKLTDMGIAKVCVGKTYTVCGTTDYFAPETLRQCGHNRAVDWWALGVLMFIMLTGRSPFDAPDTMKVYRKIMKGFAKVTFPSDFPEHGVSMVKALCQKNPEERLTMGSLGVQNYKDHPWYRNFSWSQLESMVLDAPFIPPNTEEAAVAKAARSTLTEEHSHIPFEDDGTRWDEFFAK